MVVTSASLADAFISSWGYKFRINLIRPRTLHSRDHRLDVGAGDSDAALPEYPPAIRRFQHRPRLAHGAPWQRGLR